MSTWNSIAHIAPRSTTRGARAALVAAALGVYAFAGGEARATNVLAGEVGAAPASVASPPQAPPPALEPVLPKRALTEGELLPDGGRFVNGIIHRPNCRHFVNGIAVVVPPTFRTPSRGSLAKQALHALDQGELQEALALAARGAERNPEDADAWLALADAQAKLGHLLAAREAVGSCALRATGAGAKRCAALLAVAPTPVATSAKP